MTTLTISPDGYVIAAPDDDLDPDGQMIAINASQLDAIRELASLAHRLAGLRRALSADERERLRELAGRVGEE